MNIINEFFVSFILIKLYFKFKVCRKIKFPLLWKFYFSKWKFYFSADKKPILWHSCNGLKIAKAMDKRLNYKLDTLLEINSANELSKSGLNPDQAIEEYLQIQEECPNLNLCGVMSIGSHSEDQREIEKSFETTYKIYEKLQKHGAKICSMGMSNDFEIAIKCGSNMVRLGSILFKNLK